MSICVLILFNCSALVSGYNYPNDQKSREFLFANYPVTSISWFENTNSFAAAWQLQPTDDSENIVQFGTIAKSSFHTDQNFSFVLKKTITIPAAYADPTQPSIVYLDDGTIMLVIIMREKMLSNGGIYFILSTNDGTSWTSPKLLTGLNETILNAPHLMVLNSSAYVLFWEETVSSNNSLVYRITQDQGTTWSDKQFLYQNITAKYNFCYRTDGTITLLLYFNHFSNATIPSYPYGLELNRNTSSWNTLTPFLLNNETGGDTININIMTFDDEMYLYNTGNNLFFFNKTSNVTSPPFSIELKSIASDIASTFKITDTNFVIFFNDNGRSYYCYANNIDWVQYTKDIYPILIFVIAIAAIIGGQVLIFLWYKKRKKNQPIHIDKKSTPVDASDDENEKKPADSPIKKEKKGQDSPQGPTSDGKIVDKSQDKAKKAGPRGRSI